MKYKVKDSVGINYIIEADEMKCFPKGEFDANNLVVEFYEEFYEGPYKGPYKGP